MWRTTPTPARSIATGMTARSRTSRFVRPAPTVRTASRKRAWAWAIGDFDHNGTMDILKTNFAGDTTTLYANMGDGFCEDRTFDSGLGLNTRWLGWGAGFADFDNDGWLDIFLTNGHVYPEVRQLRTEAGYEQRKVVYRNVNGHFEDVSERLGPPVDDTEGRARHGVRRRGRQRHRGHRCEQRPCGAGPVPDDGAAAESLAAAATGRHTVEPERHRREGDASSRDDGAGQRSARRWQLPLPERSARAFRSRCRRAHRSHRRALAERT